MHCLVVFYEVWRAPVFLRIPVREIGVKAFCDGRRGTQWRQRGLGEVFPTRKANKYLTEICCIELYG